MSKLISIRGALLCLLVVVCSSVTLVGDVVCEDMKGYECECPLLSSYSGCAGNASTVEGQRQCLADEAEVPADGEWCEEEDEDWTTVDDGGVEVLCYTKYDCWIANGACEPCESSADPKEKVEFDTWDCDDID